MQTYTVFCTVAGSGGSTWIDAVEAQDVENAKTVAIQKCVEDWCLDEDDKTDI